MNGNRMPLVLKHVFNSNDRNVNIGYGAGWRLNISQKIEKVWFGNILYFIYTDEDGTKHYFNTENGIEPYPLSINDESGLGLTLTRYNDPFGGAYDRYIITDKSDNKLKFSCSSKDLVSIEDSYYNKLTINYSEGLITSVTDGAGRTTTFNYTEGLLTSIVDPAGRITSFSYNGERLTGITYPDTMVSSYTYKANGNLESATTYYGYKMTCSYYSQAPYRVQKVKESNSDGTQGQELNFT
jgi:YD repeat-containing protein